MQILVYGFMHLIGCYHFQVVITSALIEGKLLLIGSHRKTEVNFRQDFAFTINLCAAISIL
jgi:hypothetical protein